MPNRVFVLCTGRCGSRTWAAACRHIAGWTVGHESQAKRLVSRLDYPAAHIEVDNRLAWFLGSLERLYGDDPVYVHLRRDPEAVAASLVREPYGGRTGIMPAFHGRMVRTRGLPRDRLAAARLYVQTVADNVEAFLRGKPRVVRVPIEEPREGFNAMVGLIGAECNFAAAYADLDSKRGETMTNA